MREKDNINIETLHFDADNRLMEYVWNKVNHLNKIYDRIESCDVVLKEESDTINLNKFVEINLMVPQKTLFAKEHDESFELATDRVVNELEKQLKRHKDKLSSKHKLPIDESINKALEDEML